MGKIVDSFLEKADNQSRWYEWAKLEKIAPKADPVRKDYETHSVILIDRYGEDGEPIEITLVNADTYKKLGSAENRAKYMVLVQYTGSGKDVDAIGTIVRMKTEEKKPKTTVSDAVKEN